MLRTGRAIGIWAFSACAWACVPADRGGAAPNPPVSSQVAPARAIAAAPGDGGTSSTVEAAGPAFTISTDRKIMDQLETRGASLAALLEGTTAPLANDALATKPRYASMLRVFDEDVRAAQAADAAAGVGMAKSHRLLDVRTLRSKKARFELIGVSVRHDRAHVRAGACGEARLIYRLAYETTKETKKSKIDIASRLPATLALTYWLADTEAKPAGDCRALAARTRIDPSKVTADWLASESGPIGALSSLPRRFKSVETNLQVVRWPSTTRPDLAGHAEYVLRVFEPTKDGQLAPGRLENTPDVALLAKDPPKREALARWVKDNLAAIDDGTAILPDSFLATKSVSVSPRGLARLANRPFRQILEPDALAPLAGDLAARAFVKSPEALVRRLDQLSCAGCHQSRSVAGFHLLGEDRTAGANSIAVALSPHATSEAERRARAFERIADGKDRGLVAHPPAERAPHDKGGYGARCGLGDPGFAAWTCDEGLRCDKGDRAKGENALVGTCLPKTPAIGDPCEHSIVSRDANPARDRGTTERVACAAGAVCGGNAVGFPGGMCSTSCAGAGKDGVCGAIPILVDFNACLGQGEAFERCIADNARPAGIRACDSKNPCREDYICARAPAGGDRGACMPPYFLFQLRVDGHPILQD